MIGLIIVAHGDLGTEFLRVLEHVMGPQEQVAALDIHPEDDIEERRLVLCEKIKAFNTGEGVLLLTDMFGGTPSNLAISFLNEKGVEVIAGVNVPMLVKLVSVRTRESLSVACVQAQEAARNYINVASHLLAAN